MKSITTITLSVTLFLLLLANTAFGQNYKDRVFLKNGKVYEGIIIEQIPGKSIQIKLQDESIVEINYSTIDKLSKIIPDPKEVSANFEKGPVDEKKRKSYFNINLGLFDGDASGLCFGAGLNYIISHSWSLSFQFLKLQSSENTLDAPSGVFNHFDFKNYIIKATYHDQLNSKMNLEAGFGVGIASSDKATAGKAVTSPNAIYLNLYNSGTLFNPSLGLYFPFNNEIYLFTTINYYSYSFPINNETFTPNPATFQKPKNNAGIISFTTGIRF